jgi:hypothetical protein
LYIFTGFGTYLINVDLRISTIPGTLVGIFTTHGTYFRNVHFACMLYFSVLQYNRYFYSCGNIFHKEAFAYLHNATKLSCTSTDRSLNTVYFGIKSVSSLSLQKKIFFPLEGKAHSNVQLNPLIPLGEFS